MAVKTWLGRQSRRAQQGTLTVTTASTGGTITVTVGGVKSVVITPTTTNTTTTAAEIAAACAASEEGEFQEIEWASAAAVVTFVGPADGAPIAVTKTDGGSNATTLNATVVAPLSPHDLGDAKNYSGGTLPSAADSLVFENSTIDAKYNAAALTGVALASVTRRSTFTGRLGLPALNESGETAYPEYRAAEVEFDAPIVYVEMSEGDAAGQVRIKSVCATAVTVTVQGDGSNAAIGSEAVQIQGTPANSILRANGGSVQAAAQAGQTGTFGTVIGQNATVWLGSGATIGNVTLTNCIARTDATLTTLTQYEGGTTDVRGSAAVGNAGLKVYGGTVAWRSTGATGSGPVVGTGAVVDFSQAPNGVTVGGTVALYAGSTWNDPSGKIATPYNVQTVNCKVADVAMAPGVNKTLAIS